MSPEKFHDCLASPPASPLPKPAESAAETTAQSAAEHFVFHSDMSNFGTVRAHAKLPFAREAQPPRRCAARWSWAPRSATASACAS